MSTPWDAPRPLLPIVAAALIDPQRRVLVQRRPAGKPLAGLWEFPGGKIEPGEAPEAALARELWEELGVEVAQSALQPLTFATEELAGGHLLLLLYIAYDWRGTPEARVADELMWCDAASLQGLSMPPADVPLVARLSEIL
ncbi:MAG: (deoxy)nucleoside triphosphate pyrophosphohydrolase [Chakrabartia sp.]